PASPCSGGLRCGPGQSRPSEWRPNPRSEPSNAPRQARVSDGRLTWRRVASLRWAAMRLTSWEEERLLIFTAAELARRHRSAGLPLNQPEAVALICDAMLEAARAGGGYADVEAAGRAAVAPGEVMQGVRELIDDVRLEVLFDEGTRLIVLQDPLAPRVSGEPADGRGVAPPDR